MTKIPSNDILEGLCKVRARESEKLMTVLELYDLETHQKKLGPDYHRLKTLVKRRKPETEIIRQTPWSRIRGTKQRGQRILGECWQWNTNGQCSKGDNCSFRQDNNKRAKLTQPNPSPSSSARQNERNVSRTRSLRGRSPSGRMFRLLCKVYFKGICINSFCERWHPPECLFNKSENGCKFGEKCSSAHRQVEEQSSKRSEQNGDQSAAGLRKSTRQLGRVFQDMDPPKSSSILRKSSNN